MMTQQQAIEFVAAESERQVIERFGHEPDAWLTGGTQHTDYRLTASIDEDDGSFTISDSGTWEAYDGELTENALRDYIAAWLDITMEDIAQEAS